MSSCSLTCLILVRSWDNSSRRTSMPVFCWSNLEKLIQFTPTKTPSRVTNISRPCNSSLCANASSIDGAVRTPSSKPPSISLPRPIRASRSSGWEALEGWLAVVFSIKDKFASGLWFTNSWLSVSRYIADSKSPSTRSTACSQPSSMDRISYSFL